MKRALGQTQRYLIVGFQGEPAITIWGTDVMGQKRQFFPHPHYVRCTPITARRRYS